MSTDYEPMAEVRKNFRVDWYRSPIAAETLRTLTRRSELQGLVQACGPLALFACTGLATTYFFGRQLWLGFALAFFAHGTVGSFFAGIAGHELSHGTVFKTKWLNRFFLYVYGPLGWFNHHDYAFSHTYHHVYTLHPRGDREVVLPRTPSLSPSYLLQLFTFNVFGGLESNGLIPIVRGTILTALGKYDPKGPKGEWIEAVYARHPAARRQSIVWARWVLLFHLAVIVGAIVFELWLLPVLLTLHLFTANWLRYFVGLPMHCGLRSNVPDFRLCVRSITLDPLSEFLYWRMNWHTEHHMFAAVPCYNLKKLHRAVAHDMPKPRTLIGAWREMRQTWRKQREDPSYEYDTPLPEPATSRAAAADPLATSIGDLAPAALRARCGASLLGQVRPRP